MTCDALLGALALAADPRYEAIDRRAGRRRYVGHARRPPRERPPHGRAPRARPGHIDDVTGLAGVVDDDAAPALRVPRQRLVLCRAGRALGDQVARPSARIPSRHPIPDSCPRPEASAPGSAAGKTAAVRARGSRSGQRQPAADDQGAERPRRRVRQAGDARPAQGDGPLPGLRHRRRACSSVPASSSWRCRLLRALQTQTGDTFTGNWSFLPYVIVVVVLIVLARVVLDGRVAESETRPRKSSSDRERARTSPTPQSAEKVTARRHRGEAARAARRGRQPRRRREGVGDRRSRSAVAVTAVVAAYWFGRRRKPQAPDRLRDPAHLTCSPSCSAARRGPASGVA